MKLKHFLEIVLLGCLWSPSFLFIKLAVNEIPPFTMVTIRVCLALLFLIPLLKITGRQLPRGSKTWGHFFVLGFFSLALPFFLFAIAEQNIASSLAGIINGSTPIFTALLAHRLIVGDKLTLSRTLGVLLGFTGLLVLLAPTLLDGTAEGDTWGMCAAVTAALSYAIGHIYAKRFLGNFPPLVAPTCQMIGAFVILLPFALLIDSPQNLPMPSGKAIGALAGLSFLGTFCAFILYFRVLKHSGPTNLSMAAYLFPLLSTILGVIFLNEVLGMHTYIAGGFILLGMMTVNGIIKLPLFRKKKTATQAGL